MKKHMAILLIAMTLIGFTACGGGGSGDDDDSSDVLSVESVTVNTAAGESTTLTAGEVTSDIDPTTFAVTFSEATSEEDVASAISLSCTLPEESELSQPELTVAAADETNEIFTVTTVDSYKYQLMTCVLSIDAFTSAQVSKLSLQDAVAYEFTNGCAVSDNFHKDSSQCWQVADDGNMTTWDELLDPTTGVLSFASLDYDSTNLPPNEYDVIGKAVTLDSDSYTLEVQMSYASISRGPIVLYGLTENLKVDSPDFGRQLVIGMSIDMGNVYCIALYTPDGTVASASAVSMEDCDEDTLYYLRLTVTGTAVTAEMSTDGVLYDEFTDILFKTWPPEDFSSDGLSYLGFSFGIYTEPTEAIVSINSATTSGISSEEQY